MKNEIIEKINISEKFNLFEDYWNPRIIGELNNQHIKLVKLKGEFIWHKHDEEDEMFMVIKGKLKIEFRNKSVILNESELIIVPKGIEHKPVAEEEVQILLFEPGTTLNTGNITNERTVIKPEII
jgi:mannose-6-phosphate isomerase-like protein (cupin superfamily)